MNCIPLLFIQHTLPTRRSNPTCSTTVLHPSEDGFYTEYSLKLLLHNIFQHLYCTALPETSWSAPDAPPQTPQIFVTCPIVALRGSFYLLAPTAALYVMMCSNKSTSSHFSDAIASQEELWYSPPSIQSIWLKQTIFFWRQTNATLEIGNLTGAQIYGWSCQTMQWRKAGLNLFCRIPRLHCWYLQVVLASSVSWAGGASDTVSHWSGTSWCIFCWCKSCQLHGGTSCLPHIIITSGSAIGYSRMGH